MRTKRGIDKLARLPTGVISPSVSGGSEFPAPVSQTATMEPRGAGFEAELGVPSWLRAAAWPWPEPSRVKTPMLPASPRTPGSAWSESRPRSTIPLEGRPRTPRLREPERHDGVDLAAGNVEQGRRHAVYEHLDAAQPGWQLAIDDSRHDRRYGTDPRAEQRDQLTRSNHARDVAGGVQHRPQPDRGRCRKVGLDHVTPAFVRLLQRCVTGLIQVPGGIQTDPCSPAPQTLPPEKYEP